MTTPDVAWAAGLFEGEGSAIYSRGLSGVMRMLTLVSTDRDVLDRFRAVVGAGVVVGPEKRTKALPHWKPIFRWRCTKWDNVERIIGMFLPYLLARRRAQVQVLLDHPAHEVGAPVKTHCKRGHALDEANVYRWIDARGIVARHCRACARERRSTYMADPEKLRRARQASREYHQRKRRAA